MQQAVQVALIERIFRNLEQQTSDLGPEVTTTEARDYLDGGLFERERDLLFLGQPQVACHASQIARPGDFFTFELAGLPVLVVRQSDGGVRAFLNACRHRGTLLVAARSGEGCTAFRCPYHAWTYACDGRLLGVTHERTFGPVDRTQHGLVALPCEERCGFVWVLGRSGGRLDLAAYGVLSEEIAALCPSSSVLYQPTRKRWRVNWKLIVDGALEGYHFRYAHQATVYPLFFDNVMLHDEYGASCRAVYPKRTVRELRDQEPSTWELRKHANILYFLFPSTLLLVQPDHSALIWLSPVAPDATDVEVSLIIPEAPRSPKSIAHWERNRTIILGALDEDFALGEKIQQTLHSGANQVLTFGRNEWAISRFHQSLHAALRPDLPAAVGDPRPG